MKTTPHFQMTVVVFAASVLGLTFTAVSTYDSMLHLDRQIHGLHCSYLPGIGGADASQESGCYTTMMSVYSSVLRRSIWGGIPVALPGMSVFAFLAFLAGWMWISKKTDDSRATTLLAAAAAVPAATSLVMGYIAAVTLDTVCKTCVGIYVASGIVFGGALYLFFKSRQTGPKPPALTRTVMLGFTGLFGAFIVLPVSVYAAAAPDFSRYVGNCGALEFTQDPHGVMVPLGPQNRDIELIEVMDPLCGACGLFAQRFTAMSESERLRRKLLLFPLDNTCNWMVDEAIHPGACAVSEAIICAKDRAEEVLQYAFENRETIIDTARSDNNAAARAMAEKFPWIAHCIGSSGARAKLNLALRFAVKNRLQVLTPQIYVSGLRLCDEDTDLGLEYALSRLIDRVRAMPDTPRAPAPATMPLPADTPKLHRSAQRPKSAKPVKKRDDTEAHIDKPASDTPPPAHVPTTPISTDEAPPEKATDASEKNPASPTAPPEAPLSPLPKLDKEPLSPLPDKPLPPPKQEAKTPAPAIDMNAEEAP